MTTFGPPSAGPVPPRPLTPREKMIDAAVRIVLIDMRFITCQCQGCKISHIREQFWKLYRGVA